MAQRNASYHQFQRFVLHLRFHIDDPPRNSLWKWKPSPASAARKCGDVIYFALTHSSGRAVSHGGGGMVMTVQWTDATIGQIFPKEARPQVCVSCWLAERATKAAPTVTPPNKKANGRRCCCYPEGCAYAKSINRISTPWNAAHFINK